VIKQELEASTVKAVPTASVVNTFTREFEEEVLIKFRVKKVLSSLHLDRLDIFNDAFSETSIYDLGVDSLDSVLFVMTLEEEFGIEIHDEEAEHITTVQQAIDCVNRKLKEA